MISEMGKAATLAHAGEIGAAAVLDDCKAIRVARMQFPELPVLSTLDLLSCSSLRGKVSQDELAGLVVAALRNARMRVPMHFKAWVVGVIGAERAGECVSIRKPARAKKRRTGIPSSF